MSIPIQNIFNIDYNTNRLIYLFNTGNFEIMDPLELSWMINQLNAYQYLYLLNEVIQSIHINNQNLELFFSFEYGKPKDINFNNGNNVLIGVNLKYKRFALDEVIFSSPEEGIIELTKYHKLLIEKNIPLIKKIREKLKRLNKKLNHQQPCYLELNFIEEDEFGYPLGDNSSFFSDTEGLFSKIDIIRNEFYYNFDLEYYWATNTQIDKLMQTFVSKARIHYFNYYKKELDYKLQIIFPLIFPIKDWEKLILKNLTNCNNGSEFDSTKKFFKECLSEYMLISGSEYLSTKYHEREEMENQKYKVNNDLVDLKKMVNWIDQTFISLNNINHFDDYKFIDVIDESNKLILSSKMNQRVLLNILIKYFESNNLEFNKNKLHSLVLHFTTIEETEKKLGYKSKFLPFIRLEYIDFIPENHTSNIIKIFLKMLDKGIIKTKINKTFKIMELMFSKNKVQGFKKDTAKYYWKNKGEKGEGLVIENANFWNFFLRQLPR